MLCESPTSYGPDFVALQEGKFCDMETKTLWSLCGDDQAVDCFDTGAHDIRLTKRLGKRAVPALAGMKSYTQVTDWE